MSALTDHVDVFFGVGGNGSCLPGPYLPMGIVRLSPDVLPPNAASGYRTDRPIYRFSHTHVSGTGGGGRYGNAGLLPFVGPITVHQPGFDRAEERGSVGYYAVRLVPSNILCELTCTRQCGVHRYTFAQTAHNRILFDAGSCIQDCGGAEPGTRSIGGHIELAGEHEISGCCEIQGGWGHDHPYQVFFFATVDTPVSWFEAAAGETMFHARRAQGPGPKLLLCFNDPVVTVRVGISFVSIENARAALEREAAGKSFEQVRAAAVQTWDQALGRVTAGSADRDAVRLFYSALHRFLCMPTDLGVDSENHLWRSGVRQFGDFYCLWDSVRNADALRLLLFPEVQRDILNALLDVADHAGWIPDAWIAGHYADVQGGVSADALFCEAALKGLDGVDYRRALAHMERHARVQPPDPRFCGRYVAQSVAPGYLPESVPSCVSRQIEYSYQDFCLSALAARIGEKEIAARALADSENLWNLWRDDKRCFAPRHASGAWVEPFDPLHWDEPLYRADRWFYEGTPFEWALSALHCMPRLVEKHGGPATFAAHLDWLLDGRIFWWKEITLHIPLLYHWAGMPHRSSEQARRYLREKYSPGPLGLPDNEDMGSHSAFIMGVLAGIYPVMGQDLYLLTAPLLEETIVSMGERRLRIVAPDASAGRPFIQSARLNGKELVRAWIRHEEIAEGGTLELALGTDPSGWATGMPPPSQQTHSRGQVDSRRNRETARRRHVI